MRGQSTNSEVNFIDLVTSYAENKATVDEFSKICDVQNKEIKEYLHKSQSNGGEYGEYTVTLKQIDKSYMDSEALLDFCKSHNITACIRTMEFVDKDILETMIYNGEIDTDTIVAMNSCKISKFQENLYVKKTKKKGNNNE